MARTFKLYHKSILVYVCESRDQLRQGLRLYYAVAKSAYLTNYDFVFAGLMDSLDKGSNHYQINDDLKLIWE